MSGLPTEAEAARSEQSVALPIELVPLDGVNVVLGSAPGTWAADAPGGAAESARR